MKKIYQSPFVEEVKLETCEMLAASLPVFDETVTGDDVLSPALEVDDEMLLGF